MREILEQAKTPIVLCSFGKDSLLLLAMAREIIQDIPVLWFHRDRRDAFAEQIIADWNLTVFDYAPADVSIVPNGDGFSLISDYAFGNGAVLPVLEDIELGEQCCGLLDKQRLINFGFGWDLTLCGWRTSDHHPVYGANQPWIPEDGAPWGNTWLMAPIRDMSDAEVYAALDRRGIPRPPEDSGINLCTRCLKGATFCPVEKMEIPKFDWQPQASLAAFRQRFV